MQELAGKTAFVTGGASGIGLALGRAFAEAGVQVMLADIETEALAAAVKSLHNFGPDVRGVTCDVTDPESVERAAAASFEAFRNVHVVCNNAGVAGGSGIDDILLDDWRWVLDVNLMGVLHGIRTFLPHIRAHGEGGHIVNTASMAGMVSGLGFSPYSASKFAVVTMSEGLALHLKPLGIGVTVLCDGCAPASMRARATERSVTAWGGHQSRALGEAKSRRTLPNASSPGSTRPMSQRTCSRRSATTISTCSPIRRCASPPRNGLPRSLPPWTRRVGSGVDRTTRVRMRCLPTKETRFCRRSA
jgi:NAD(P)-dependent dehydrogenase (short-subunit alcohol dehydrogenase family)